jgi:hypothetical protein
MPQRPQGQKRFGICTFSFIVRIALPFNAMSARCACRATCYSVGGFGVVSAFLQSHGGVSFANPVNAPQKPYLNPDLHHSTLLGPSQCADLRYSNPHKNPIQAPRSRMLFKTLLASGVGRVCGMLDAAPEGRIKGMRDAGPV